MSEATARVLLIMATHTYRAKAFLQAARQLGIEVVVASERRQALANRVPNTTLALDFRRPDRAARQVADFAAERPLDAIVGVDDDTTVIAAKAATELGLPHNSIEAVRAARDKFQTRRRLSVAGLPTPRFKRFSTDADPRAVAAWAPYPCVLKPVALAASRGVIRADDPEQLVDAFQRIKRMLEADGSAATTASVPRRHILVESFIPGPEVALEGLLTGGRLNVLALFDKPDPLDGPYFEETIYVTPSRLPQETQNQIAESTARAASALGLHDGPLHAELRLGPGGPWVGEVAPRSIGGLCSNALRFGTGMSLEELILRHAIGADLVSLQRERSAAGVMMLPIPRPGTLREIRGRDDAEAVPGVEEISITIPLHRPVVPLPEGDRYLGFLFARAETPADVEASLREAHRRLGFVITSPDEPEDAVYLAAPARRLLPMAQASR